MPYIAIVVLWFCGVDYQRGPVLFDFENTICDVKISYTTAFNIKNEES